MAEEIVEIRVHEYYLGQIDRRRLEKFLRETQLRWETWNDPATQERVLRVWAPDFPEELKSIGYA